MRHRAPGYVQGGIVTPRYIQFRVRPFPDVKVNKIAGLAEELALALGCTRVRVAREGALVHVEVPLARPGARASAAVVRLPGRAARICGRTWRGGGWASPAAAPAFTGRGACAHRRHDRQRQDRAGVGHAGLPGALQSTVRIAVAAGADPKGRGFRSLQTLPHVRQGLIADSRAAHNALLGVIQEMEARRPGAAQPAAAGRGGGRTG